MATKSDQTCKNIILALLLLWSIVSLVVIVVWATSPDLKSSAQCRAELHETTVKLEGAKVVWNKDRVALEEKVEAEREETARHQAQILVLMDTLNATNATLEQCRQEQVVLLGNISALEEVVQQLRDTETNLTAQLKLMEDQVELLQENQTQLILQAETHLSLKAAAESRTTAAESQTRACESGQQFLQKKLQRCKEECSTPPPEKQQEDVSSQLGASSSSPSPLAVAPSMALLVCCLHLLT